MKIGREAQLLIGAFAALLLIVVLAVVFLPAPATQSSSIANEDSDGLSTLNTWFENAGFEVERLSTDIVDLTDIDVLYIVSPPGSHAEREIQVIDDWVQSGGRLVVASGTAEVNALLAPYKVAVSGERVRNVELSLTAPTLTDPAFEDVPIFGASALTLDRPDAVVHLSSDALPVLVSFPAGDGQVLVSGAVRPFTNNGLESSASQHLVANLMAGVQPPARIAFDEAQLATDDLAPSLLAWLLTSTIGRSLLLSAGLIFAYIISSGRRFGAPVPLLEDRLRREPVEYIIAIASLYRRSGRRVETLQHYKAQLRRHLVTRYNIDPATPDDTLAKLAATRNPSVDADQLRQLLRDLSQTNVSEGELLSLAERTDNWQQIHMHVTQANP